MHNTQCIFSFIQNIKNIINFIDIKRDVLKFIFIFCTLKYVNLNYNYYLIYMKKVFFCTYFKLCFFFFKRIHKYEYYIHSVLYLLYIICAGQFKLKKTCHI